MGVALPNFADFPSRLSSCTGGGGGTSTPASPTDLGGVYTNVVDSHPTVYLGVIPVDTIADLLALPNKSSNAIAMIKYTSPGDPQEVVWDNNSTEASDPPNVYLPNDTLVGNPGRWKFRHQ